MDKKLILSIQLLIKSLFIDGELKYELNNPEKFTLLKKTFLIFSP